MTVTLADADQMILKHFRHSSAKGADRVSLYRADLNGAPEKGNYGLIKSVDSVGTPLGERVLSVREAMNIVAMAKRVNAERVALHKPKGSLEGFVVR